MLRKKESENKLFYNFNLDTYIPQDHILRIINENIDFEFIRDCVKHLYSNTGQPAIDPVVLVKMLLIGYLYNIKSERQLAKDIQVNLAYRWFINYDIDEKIPDHSTISQTRRRKFKDSTIFQDIFDGIVRQCIALGLIDGETILIDSTHIKANASFDSLVEVVITPEEFINRLDENSSVKMTKSDVSNNDNQANNGSQETPISNKKRRYSNSTHRSRTDPDSRLMGRRGKPHGLHYLEHRSIDLSGYITDVHVTPSNIQDNKPCVERVIRQKWVFKFPLFNVVADRAYGVGKVYKGLSEMNINAYIDQYTRQDKRKGMFDYDDFIYDKKNDYYICPQGHQLTRRSKEPKDGKWYLYNAGTKYCNKGCELRNTCTITKRNRSRIIKRSIHQDCVDRQLQKKGTKDWYKLLRKRKTLIEGSFGDAKNNHGLGKARLRGIKNVQEQSLLIATVQNIKKMVKDINRRDNTTALCKQNVEFHFMKHAIYLWTGSNLNLEN